jgi:hypothetical protein
VSRESVHRRPYELSLAELREEVWRRASGCGGSAAGPRNHGSIAAAPRVEPAKCSAKCGGSTHECEGDSCIGIDGYGCSSTTDGVTTKNLCLTSTPQGVPSGDPVWIGALAALAARTPPTSPHRRDHPQQQSGYAAEVRSVPAVCVADCGLECFAGPGQGCGAGSAGCSVFILKPDGGYEPLYNVPCPPPVS